MPTRNEEMDGREEKNRILQITLKMCAEAISAFIFLMSNYSVRLVGITWAYCTMANTSGSDKNMVDR